MLLDWRLEFGYLYTRECLIMHFARLCIYTGYVYIDFDRAM